MRVLVVGDTHGDLGWVSRVVIPTARELRCDVIMQLGDFGFVWDTALATVERVLTPLCDLLATHQMPLHFLPGNHENHPMLEQLAASAPRSPEGHAEIMPWIYYTGRVATWEWHGHRIAAVGGATSIDKDDRLPGVSWWPEEELTEAEAEHAKTLGPVDVLFTHDGPPDVPFTFLIPDARSEIHRQRIGDVARILCPRCWLHGHYHAHAEYVFRHSIGWCVVKSLDCNGTPRNASMCVLDLAAMNERRD